MKTLTGKWTGRAGCAQGLFYAATGVWPIVHLPSFYVLTGPKTDGWLVQTVGALLAVFGIVLLRAARRRTLAGELRTLAIGFAFTLSVVDVVFVTRGTISSIYLADAAAEVLLVAGWLAAAAADRDGTAAQVR